MTTGEVCVAHLVRSANDLSAFRNFLDSYRQHPAGVPHDLLILFKGFDNQAATQPYDRLLEGVRHVRRHITDTGFDIDAYFHVARVHDARVFCFLNSFSVILADGWLQKMYGVLVERRAGLVGATGSWQSITTDTFENMGRPITVQMGYPAWKRVLFTRFPLLRELWRPIRVWMMGRKFAAFPNYHLRTNAFLIPRDVALKIRVAPLRRKFDAYEFESGLRGLTRQVLQMGKPILVVGRDGKAYEMAHWHESNTFWRRGQENLLVADNQTRGYERSDRSGRAIYSAYAWGSAADPAPAPATGSS